VIVTSVMGGVVVMDLGKWANVLDGEVLGVVTVAVRDWGVVGCVDVRDGNSMSVLGGTVSGVSEVV